MISVCCKQDNNPGKFYVAIFAKDINMTFEIKAIDSLMKRKKTLQMRCLFHALRIVHRHL